MVLVATRPLTDDDEKRRKNIRAQVLQRGYQEVVRSASDAIPINGRFTELLKRLEESEERASRAGQMPRD